MIKLWRIYCYSPQGNKFDYTFESETKARQQAAIFMDAGVNVTVSYVGITNDHDVPWPVATQYDEFGRILFGPNAGQRIACQTPPNSSQ